jgi:Replication initiation factor
MGTWKVMEAHVDWLTATAGTGDGGTDLLDLGSRLLSVEREKGNYGRPSNFEGYHGTISESLFVGWRLDGSCIRLGGGMARDWWRDVAGSARNVTRLDLAVTAICDPPDPAVALGHWNSLPPQRPGTGRPTEYQIIQARIGGATLYCGKRASERFGRIYDKFRESKGEHRDGSWRYEVEYKGQAAKEVSGYLRQHADLGPHICSIVARRFAEWGVVVPWPVPPWDWKETYQPKKTDNESRMKWLREQVRLSLEKLSTAYTADQIRLALGLQFGHDAVARVMDQVAKEVPSGSPAAAKMAVDRANQAHLDSVSLE